MRRRILLAIGGTLLVMLVIISLASSALLRDSYAALEHRYIERDVQRILADFSRQESSVGRTAAGLRRLDRHVRVRPAPEQGIHGQDLH